MIVCLWSVLCSYFSQITLEFVGSGPRNTSLTTVWVVQVKVMVPELTLVVPHS